MQIVQYVCDSDKKREVAVALCQRHAPVVTTFHGSDCSGEIPWQSAVSWAVARLSTPVFVSAHLADRLGVRNGTVVPAAVDTDVFRPRDRVATRRRRRLRA